MALSKLILGVFIIAALSASVSFAEPPDLSKSGVNKTSPSSSLNLQNLIKNKEETSASYLDSMRLMALGLEMAAKAFEIRDQITDKLAVINSLQPDNISEAGISKAKQDLDEMLGMIKAKMESKANLSPASKKLFAEGVTALAGNAKSLQNLIPKTKNLLSAAQGVLAAASDQDKLKIQEVISIASALSQTIPLDQKLNQDILSIFNNYASARGISKAINLPKLK